MAGKKMVKPVATTGRTVGKKSVDVETFLRKVVEASKKKLSQTWVARELGITPAAVSLRIKYLREQGVKNLPEFPRGNVEGSSRLDVNALNNLVKKMRG
jgi:predicted transcriptional regulator